MFNFTMLYLTMSGKPINNKIKNIRGIKGKMGIEVESVNEKPNKFQKRHQRERLGPNSRRGIKTGGELWEV